MNIYYINENNLDEIINNDEPYDSEKISAAFILILAITLIIMDLLSLYYSYNYLL